MINVLIMYIIYIHIDLSVILRTTEAVMALHSIYKPLAPKKIPTTVRVIQKTLFYSSHFILAAWWP